MPVEAGSHSGRNKIFSFFEIYFLKLYFVLECSQLTMLRFFQVHSRVTQLYIYMYPFSPYHPDCWEQEIF